MFNPVLNYNYSICIIYAYIYRTCNICAKYSPKNYYIREGCPQGGQQKTIKMNQSRYSEDHL